MTLNEAWPSEAAMGLSVSPKHLACLSAIIGAIGLSTSIVSAQSAADLVSTRCLHESSLVSELILKRSIDLKSAEMANMLHHGLMNQFSVLTRSGINSIEHCMVAQLGFVPVAAFTSEYLRATAERKKLLPIIDQQWAEYKKLQRTCAAVLGLPTPSIGLPERLSEAF